MVLKDDFPVPATSQLVPIVPKDDFPVPATSQLVACQVNYAAQRRLSGPKYPISPSYPAVIYCDLANTTFRSQRPRRHHYDDPAPTGAASCHLQRSRQRRLSGPSDRPDILTTILSHRARPVVIYNDLVKDDFPVPATAQTSLRRSCPTGRGQLLFTTISSKTIFRFQRGSYISFLCTPGGPKCGGSSLASKPHFGATLSSIEMYKTITSASIGSAELSARSTMVRRSPYDDLLTTIRSHRARPAVIYNDLVKDDFPVPPGAASCHLQRSRQRRLSGPSDDFPVPATTFRSQRRLSGPSDRPDILTTIRPHQARPAVIYNDLVKDDFSVPAIAQTSLRRSGPTGRGQLSFTTIR